MEVFSLDRLAVYAGTRNIYHDMLVSAKSLLYHHGADRVVFLIEDDAFPEELPACITTMNVSDQTFFPASGPNYKSKWTYMVMMRTALCKLFPDVDRILSLDHDAIIRKPIDTIWNTDLSSGNGYYFAAVEECQIRTRTRPYYNCGVLLHNLSLLRDGTADVIMRSVNTIQFPFCEQDAINSICRRQIFPLPPEFNAMFFNIPQVPEHDVAIRHYAAYNSNLRLNQDYKFYERLSWDEVFTGGISHPSFLTSRHDVINAFISDRGYTSFLEIGTDTGTSIRNVKASKIVSVDPDRNTPATCHMTSDAYFSACTDMFDVVFIDGLHECNQVVRDIHNALQHLNTGGVIVLHDCLPTSEKMQEHHTTSQHYEWTGDVWKAFVACRHDLPYEMYVIDTDYGCGIIDTRLPKQSDTSALPTDMNNMSYSQFVTHRNDWMNVKGGIVYAT